MKMISVKNILKNKIIIIIIIMICIILTIILPIYFFVIKSKDKNIIPSITAKPSTTIAVPSTTIAVPSTTIAVPFSRLVVFDAGEVKKWTVPSGVSQIRIYVQGGNGGLYGKIQGGHGASMFTYLNVSSGQIYDIVVGNNGNNGIIKVDNNGIPIQNIGGSGGTASVVMLNGKLIIVAGGGGGAGLNSAGGNSGTYDKNGIIVWDGGSALPYTAPDGSVYNGGEGGKAGGETSLRFLLNSLPLYGRPALDTTRGGRGSGGGGGGWTLGYNGDTTGGGAGGSYVDPNIFNNKSNDMFFIGYGLYDKPQIQIRW